MSGIPKAPSGLGASGRALWRAVLDDYELGAHELALLKSACATADAIDRLQTALDNDGVMSESSQGIRVHPALPELRQQRLTFARLLTALRVPTGEEAAGTAEPRGQRRGIRGVYSIAGIAS